MSNFLEVDSTALEHNLRVVKVTLLFLLRNMIQYFLCVLQTELEDDFDSFFGGGENTIGTDNNEPERTFKVVKPEPGKIFILLVYFDFNGSPNLSFYLRISFILNI